MSTPATQFQADVVKAKKGDNNAQVKVGEAYYKGAGVVQDYKQAYEWFHKAAKKGNSEAQWYLGRLYNDGLGVTKDEKQAFKWYQKAADQGYAKAQCSLGCMYETGMGVAKDYKQAFKWYHKSAQQGYANGQYNLALLYENGYGVVKDNKQSFEWLQRVALQGDAEAQFRVGVKYANGEGVVKDDKKALELYHKAAQQGNVNAQYSLGLRYKNGNGVPQDLNIALAWFQEAAKQGDIEALKWVKELQDQLAKLSASNNQYSTQTNVGYNNGAPQYVTGSGALQPVQYTQQFPQYSQMASSSMVGYSQAGVVQNMMPNNVNYNNAYYGNASYGYNSGVPQYAVSHPMQYAQPAVGYMPMAPSQPYIQMGVGNPQSAMSTAMLTPEEQFQAHLVNAKAGDSNSQSYVGFAYDEGTVVKQDFKQAYEWLTKAVAQGNSIAQFNLGRMYDLGRGVPRDFDIASKWYSLAAQQGNEGAKSRLAALEIEKFERKKKEEQIEKDKLEKKKLEDQRALEREKAEKLKAEQAEKQKREQAERERQQKIEKADRERQQKLEQSERERLQKLDQAERERLRKLEQVEREREQKAQKEREKKEAESKKEMEAMKKQLQQLQQALTVASSPRQNDDKPKPQEKSSKREDSIGSLNSSSSAEVQELLKEAKAGDAAAQFKLARAYKKGQGVPKDAEEALKWFKKAALQGHLKAQYNLALMYDSLQQYEDAFIWYEKAAEKGDGSSQYNLGIAYKSGQGVAQNLEKAREWLQKSADQGDPDAIQALEKLPKQRAETPKKPETHAPKRPSSAAFQKVGLETKKEKDIPIDSLVKQFEQQLSHQSERNRQLEEMVQAATIQAARKNSGGKEADSKSNIEKIVQEVLKDYLKNQGAIAVQKTTRNVDEEFQALTLNYEGLNSEIAKLRSQAETDSSVFNRLRKLEEEVNPLLEEYHENRRILQIEMNIFHNLALKTFYNHFQAKLNHLFLAYMVISSKAVDRSDDNVNSSINLLGKVLNIVSLGTSSVVAGGVNAMYNKVQNKKIGKVADRLLISVRASEEIVKRVALELTQRYEDQIRETTEPGQESLSQKVTYSQGPNGGAETLAECAVYRILKAIEKKKIDEKLSLEQAMVECVFADTKKRKDIPNKKRASWTDVGIFRESGIRTTDNKWFAGKSDCCHKQNIYGYRRGTEEEATKLKLLPQKAPASTGPVLSPALGKQITDLTEDAKVGKDQFEIQSRVQRIQEDRTEKLARALEETKKESERKEAEAKQELEAMKKQMQQLQQALISGASSPRHMENTDASKVVILSSTAKGSSDSTADSAPAIQNSARKKAGTIKGNNDF